jgi:hypothetical protein
MGRTPLFNVSKFKEKEHTVCLILASGKYRKLQNFQETLTLWAAQEYNCFSIDYR